MCQWLPEGSVLERVYAAQLLDDLEVMNVFPLYQRLQEQLAANPQLKYVHAWFVCVCVCMYACIYISFIYIEIY